MTAFISNGCSKIRSTGWAEDYGIENREDLYSQDYLPNLFNAAQNSKNAHIRLKAILTISQHKNLSDSNLEKLSNILKKEINPTVVVTGAKVLEKHEQQDKAVAVLITHLQSSTPSLRAHAAKQLGELGYYAKAALPMLEIISTNDKRKVQRLAKNSIRQIKLAVLAEALP